MAVELLSDERFSRRTGITPDDMRMLRHMPLFSGLEEDAIQRLLIDASVRHFPRNAVLFLQGQPASQFYLLFDGWVKLFRETVDGHESVISILTRGEAFAQSAIFERGLFPVCASTVTCARLLVIPAGPFLRLLRADTDMALNMLGSISRQQRQLIHQIEQLTARTSIQRLAEFLCRLAGTGEGAVELQLPLDKALIAGRLGMQPETFSRSLAKLREHGVTIDRELVTIRDVAKLGVLAATDLEE